MVRIGYNDLSNVKQEVLLRSDKQSENVIHTVKSDPGDDQDVEETEEAMRGCVNVHTLWSHPSSLRTRTVFNGDSVTGWKGKAMLRRGFHKNERYNGPRVERFYKSNRILGFSCQSLQKRNLDHSEARS